MKRAVLAAVLIVIAIRCVGRLGVVSVGASIPPMPLKDTPAQYDDAPAPRPTFTTTPSPTPTPTPTPVADGARQPGSREPLPPPP